MSVPTGTVQTVYEADPGLMQAVHQCRERVQNVCRRHLHRRVRIRTHSGQIIEGVIVGVDDHWVYLDTAGSEPSRQPFAPYPAPYPPYYYGYGYYNPYASTVLPLALFDLLAIGLLL